MQFMHPATWDDVKTLAGYLRDAVRVNDEITIDIMPSVAGLNWETLTPHITTLDVDGNRFEVSICPGC
jgi:hypothetical protein